MKSGPLVTTIIPSYNHAQYIDTAIQSVLAQNYGNIELIVVDDGSTDDSHAVIRKYSHLPMVTTLLNTENRGQSAVMNQALAISKGKYIALLPSDDWFLPDKTTLQVEKMECSDANVGVVYAGGARYYEDTKKLVNVRLPVRTGWIAKDLIELGNFIYPITPLYRREVFEKARPNEDFKAEGEAIHMRVALFFRYEYVDDVVAVMRDHSYNIGKDAAVLYNEIDKHLKWYFSLPDLPEDVRALQEGALYRNNSIKGMQLVVDSRNFALGRACLFRAFRMRPRSLLQAKLVVAFLISLMPTALANKTLDWLKRNKEHKTDAVA